VKFAPHCTGQGLLNAEFKLKTISNFRFQIEEFTPAAESHACVLHYTSAR
jgi:hypothetical protein